MAASGLGGGSVSRPATPRRIITAAMALVVCQALAVACDVWDIWLVPTIAGMAVPVSLDYFVGDFISIGVALVLAGWMVGRNSRVAAVLVLTYALFTALWNVFSAWVGSSLLPFELTVALREGSMFLLVGPISPFLLAPAWLAVAWLCWRAQRAGAQVVPSATMAEVSD